MAGEFEIIARYFAPIAGPGALGLLDDAAIIAPPAGHDLVVTTDALVADVHFFADDPAESIAHKALGVNLSDLAAKGAAPLGFVISFIIPKELDESWIAAFASGLGLAAKAAQCPLLGGDTVVSTGPLTLSVTMFGSVPAGGMVKRDGAKPGDLLFVTGTIGDAAIGLQARLAGKEARPWLLSHDHLAFLEDRYLVPRPRNAIASAVQRYAHAAMDISDGFVGDLTKMIRLAQLGADIQLDAIPHSVAARAAMRRDPALLETALVGGDDYEVLAAVPQAVAGAFQAQCLDAGMQVSKVGVIEAEGSPIRFLGADGKERHFSKSSYVHGEG